ncbi:MAG: HAD family phosphatase [Clostridiales bacterium]|nr:HAD family phosphatase [Clostridiales bacterium]
MLNNIDAVIFDMDGTLIDSMWMWRDIDIEYLKRFAIEFPVDLQDEIEGMSFGETAIYFKERFKLEDSLDKIKSDWIQMAWDYYEKDVTVKQGVVEFLEYLKEKDIPTGIATSNSRVLTDMVLDRLKLKQYFNSIRTSCEVAKGKPSPDIYLLVAEDLKAEPSRCLVFEDVIQGVMAGKNANMKVCAVYDEYSKKDEKQIRRLADYYIYTMDEVLASIDDK